MRWLLDGTNVMGTRPDGWWRDREGAMRRLAEALAAFARETGDDVAVVFDGRPQELEVDGVDVRFASRRGRDAADDDIAALVAADDDPGSLLVVTSDRALAERVRAAGVAVEGAGRFRRRLEMRAPSRDRPGPGL